MPLHTEIIHALYGAFRLLLLDQNGMRWFNLSITGFCRSFLAAALVAPAYFMTMGSGTADGVEPDGLLLIRTVQYLIGWVAFPLVMILITRLMEWSDRYVAYIVAYNWSSVIMIGVMLPVSLLAQALRTPQSGLTLADSAYYIVFLFTLFYSWFVAHTALRISAVTAVAVVLMDLIIGFAIGLSGLRLLAGTAETVL